ncbi:RNA polymerase sigma factor SigZ [Curvivirga aplysinae]|uniref:RNA polymerase sigma factor SigZ n=1 Tax=Curvivirga aplysinae TaxID=2529852 RepID=UPI0012BD3757|nr:RNA polymerase sigma factor SigZ [Curvivirga aplysinae]MTI09927.1 RNA polymerase sigma factor SigZ [Curvivirga aplysinae]
MNTEKIWSDYKNELTFYIKSKVSNDHDTEELLQEILMRIHSKHHTLQSSKCLKTWIYQISKNAIIDFYRRTKNTSTPYCESLYQYTEIEHPFTECLIPLIKTLPLEKQELLLAIDIQEIPQKEYAEHIGISYSTLKSRVQKAREELRHAFDNCCHMSFDMNNKVIDYKIKKGVKPPSDNDS